MVDAADHEKLDGAKNELHSLLDKPQLAGIPVSVVYKSVQTVQAVLVVQAVRDHWQISH